MVKQGDIIKVNFNPQAGHEQAGYRPALVISNNFFNQKTNLTIVCPITNTNNRFPLHIPLDDRTETTGVILCEHVKALDLNARTYRVVEQLPKNLLEKVIEVVFSEIEMLTEDDFK
jgi:mRNA interferase MazF